MHLYLLTGPDAESLKFAAAKGIDLTHTWTADINDESPSEDIFDADGYNEENVNLTPLAMAFIFGNFEAAAALISHGAPIPKCGSAAGIARKRILCKLFENEKFSSILEKIEHSVEDGSKLITAFKATFADADASDDEDSDNEDQYSVSEVK